MDKAWSNANSFLAGLDQGIAKFKLIGQAAGFKGFIPEEAFQRCGKTTAPELRLYVFAAVNKFNNKSHGHP
jgi:hypothetical protein